MDTLRILVADDEVGMRMGVARALRDFTVRVPDVRVDVSFVVEQAGSGEETLDIISRDPPDILLLDHKMPGISGLEVLDRLAGMQLDLLTVMITAYASIETAVIATKRGAYDFLAKPFTPEELKSTIRKTAARLILARQARKLTEEKRRLRFEFIRVLGHELKAPLNAVAGYLDLIQKRAAGPELSAYDDMIVRSLLRIDGMHKLIRDLLDLTQMESGHKNRQLVRLDLVAMAKNSLEAVRAEAESHKITLQLDAQGAISVVADESEMEMMFNNLLSNAVKYNRDGGCVTVTLSVANSQVTVRVADTGIGISPESTERIFDEFVRIKNEKTAHIEGSGLGLSIIKKLVQLYDGDVKVESQPDVGATFTITLPAPAGEPAA